MVSYSAGGNVTLIPCEFMVFGDDTAADYRDDLEKPFVETPYIYEDGKLAMDGIGKSYVVDRKTKHVMQLYASQTEYMELIYIDTLENATIELAAEDLHGSWDVAYRRGLEQVGTEALSFDGESMTDYRNGSDEPYVTASYEWDEEGRMLISRLAKIYALYSFSHDEIYLVETDTGYVWNLLRTE